MKKILALMLAVVMAASMTVAAMAEETTAPDAPPATETPDTPETPEGLDVPDTPEGPDAPETPDTPETPDEPVEEEAPITMNGCLPGETIRLYWGIMMEGTQRIHIETDLKIESNKWTHDNTDDFKAKITDDAGKLSYNFTPTNILTQPEDIGKTIEDTIYIPLNNGETYSFHLLVTRH